MRGHDARSLRFAVVSDSIVNAAPGSDTVLQTLLESDWGVVWLPPRDLPVVAADEWRAYLDVEDVHRQGYHDHYPQ